VRQEDLAVFREFVNSLDEPVNVSSIRASFVAAFGEEQAERLQIAGDGHRGGMLDGGKHGPNPFQDAIVIAIGWECFTRPEFRKCHGITAPVDELKTWIREHGELNSYQGPIDYLALLAGWYDEYC
jgi:hypothetical protein